METAPLKSFATWARRELITQVSARLTAVLAPASPERVENQRAVTMLERDIAAAGGGAKGKDAVADKVAYTWFNRIIALRFMDANGYTGVGVVSPAHGRQTGQPEILADAKRGSIDPAVVSNKRTLDAITGLLDGTRPSADAQGEAYTLLLAEYCRYWNRSMPFMFEREGDYTELLIPANLLAADSILTRASAALTEEVCREVEVIGWLYQFYISERKDEVFAGFKKGKKAGAAEIPAATQLFTPHWIVRYLVENSVGRLWMLNHPEARLLDQMDYYIAPVDEETDFLKIADPEELTVIDPACGSGHMLTYAFDLLYAIYEEEGYAPSEIPELILTHNLYGTEIDPRAGTLAAFALTMKARARQRTFFGKQVKPNICVLEPISFSPDELTYLVTKDGDKHAEELFWNQFAEADTLGSLILPDPTTTRRLAEHLATLDDEGDILRADTIEWAARALRQAEFLVPMYCVVVANPPYMGSKNVGASLGDYIAAQFSDFKSDVFAAFVRRQFDLLVDRGIAGFVAPNVWFYLKGHTVFRGFIAEENHVVSAIELPLGGMPGATVQVAAVVAEHRRSDVRSTFIRLVDSERRGASLGKAALEVIGETDSPSRYLISTKSLKVVPGGPLAYWADSPTLEAFAKHPSLGTILTARVAMATGDNEAFVRAWPEVSFQKIGLGLGNQVEASASEKRWFPVNRGGEFRRWFGNREYVIDWEDDGKRVRGLTDPRTGRVRSHNYNGDFSFREGLTWGALNSANFGVRYTPKGSLFMTPGSSGFVGLGVSPKSIVAYLGTAVVKHFLDLISSTLNIEVGDVLRLPVPILSQDFAELAEDAIALTRDDWDEYELSLDYEGSPLLKGNADGSLVARVADLAAAQDERIQELAKLEAHLNTAAVRALGVAGLESHAEATAPITLLGKGSHAGVSEAVADLVSYAVGCIFGRYSLDEPGLILADQGATLDDYFARVPSPSFAPDADNVLPIVDGDWFEDDIVARFRQFLRVAFGEHHFEANLRFVEESLGVKTLRDYFITRAGRSKFYDDHVQRYKKRPIYWLFSTPKGSFNALIYMHRYTPSTVSTVLNEYLREFESKLEANLQHQERLAAGEGTPREKAAALKEAERLRKVLMELGEYEHDVLYPLASQQVAIDLDDGVKANYPKFYPALKKIAGLEATDD